MKYFDSYFFLSYLQILASLSEEYDKPHNVYNVHIYCSFTSKFFGGTIQAIYNCYLTETIQLNISVDRFSKSIYRFFDVACLCKILAFRSADFPAKFPMFL